MTEVLNRFIMFALRLCRANISAEFAYARNLKIVLLFFKWEICHASAIITGVKCSPPMEQQWYTTVFVQSGILNRIMKKCPRSTRETIQAWLTSLACYASTSVYELKYELYSAPYKALLKAIKESPGPVSFADIPQSGQYYYADNDAPRALIQSNLTINRKNVATVTLTQTSASAAKWPIHPWTMLLYLRDKKMLANVDAHSEASNGCIRVTQLATPNGDVCKMYPLSSVLCVVPFANFATFSGKCSIMDLELQTLPDPFEVWRTFIPGKDNNFYYQTLQRFNV